MCGWARRLNSAVIRGQPGGRGWVRRGDLRVRVQRAGRHLRAVPYPSLTCLEEGQVTRGAEPSPGGAEALSGDPLGDTDKTDRTCQSKIFQYHGLLHRSRAPVI